MRLSVVIPTRDRLPALLETLGRLDTQIVDAADVELIVVDNGSVDGTPEAVRKASWRLPLTVLAEPKPGPAAARNRGVEAARAPVILFLGDDTRPADDSLLAAHLRLHDEDQRPGAAVLGTVTWRPDKPVTPFMRWLEASGVQFGFGDVGAGPVDAARYFYTSHVSLKRAALKAAGAFDERFPYAAVEDSELGWRLQRDGLDLRYHPELVVYHDHPYEPSDLARRQECVGRSARLMHELHPELTMFASPRWTWPILSASVPLLSALAAHTPRVWEPLSMAAYVRGWRAGPPDA
jgi:glycosyltransferase involved in cell wall biosynthesis